MRVVPRSNRDRARSVRVARADPWPVAVAVVVVAAFIARSAAVLRGGGLTSDLGYDDGVYYAGAAALVRGVLPYRDVLFIQPPGVLLVLSPFAWLGSLTTDQVGFAAARLGFMAIGALNAGLVALVAGTWRRSAGLAAGLIYALWHVSATFERTTILLAPQNALILGGLLVLAWPGRSLRLVGPAAGQAASARRQVPVSARRTAVAGALLGLATSIQLWNVLIVLAAGAWLAVSAEPGPAGRRLGAAAALVAGAGLAFAVVVLPFIAVGGATTIRMVFLDQLGRPSLGVPLVTRLRAIVGGPGHAAARVLPTGVVVPLAAVGAIATGLVARVAPWARLWALVLAVQVGFLVTSNLFFPHYAAWPGPAAALLAGTAFGLVVERLPARARLRPVAAVALVLVLLAMGLVDVRRSGTPLPIATLRADTVAARCVAADEPTLLLETGTFARDILDRCRVIVDPTGVSYDTDRGRLLPGAVGPSRMLALGYQGAMLAYYGGGQAALFVRLYSDGLTAATIAALRCRLPVLLQRAQVTVRLASSTGPPSCP